MKKRIYGSEHPFVAPALNGLALVIREQGTARREAAVLGMEASSIVQAAYGDDHPLTKEYTERWGKSEDI